MQSGDREQFTERSIVAAESTTAFTLLASDIAKAPASDEFNVISTAPVEVTPASSWEMKPAVEV